MARTRTSQSIDWAVSNFPTIKGTVKKARGNGFKIVSHWVKLTNRGAVYQHLFLILNDDGTRTVWTNEELKGMMRVCSPSKTDL